MQANTRQTYDVHAIVAFWSERKGIGRLLDTEGGTFAFSRKWNSPLPENLREGDFVTSTVQPTRHSAFLTTVRRISNDDMDPSIAEQLRQRLDEKCWTDWTTNFQNEKTAGKFQNAEPSQNR